MASNVEELTGRMIGFRCDNHVNPKIGVEIFILELNKDARPSLQTTTPASAKLSRSRPAAGSP